MSTNKVYGDAPNELPLVELETRWDYARPDDRDGIDETCRIDRSHAQPVRRVEGRRRRHGAGVRPLLRHADRAASAAAASPGRNHSGVELHGFLSYLVEGDGEGRTYRIFGYKGKQVRDNIHALDVCRFFEAFHARPARRPRSTTSAAAAQNSVLGARGDRSARGADRHAA